MQIAQLKRKVQRLNLDSSDILPLAFAGLSFGVLLLAFAVFWLAVSFSKVANKPVPTLVQQVDGKAFIVRATAHTHREPEVIRRLVHDWAVMTFTWGTVPGEQSATVDAGVKVARRKAVPTSTWEAAFALAPDFRDAFLAKLATEVVPPGVFDGSTSAVLIPQHISAPQSAGEGHWQVELVATRIIFDPANPAGRTVPFNRTIYVQAVEPPKEPLIANASDYQQIIYQMLEGGVQITELRPLNPEGANP